MAPKVTVVLPTYNGIRYLKQSLDSCFAQTFRDFELIVVVDGSTDQSVQLLKQYSDPRLMLKTTENRGHSNALNAGFELAQGKYWTWTSDDNIFLPMAIEKMVECLDAHPEAAMIKAGYYKIDGEGKVFGKSNYACACFLYRAEAAKKAGPYRHEFKEVNDVDFFMRLVYYGGPIHTLNRCLYKFRFHENSQTTRFQGKRELTSLRMHYDLITRAISNESLHEVFFDRARRAAIFKAWPTVNEMLAFAEEKKVPFLNDFKKLCGWLQSNPGWLFNRVRIALWTRYFALNIFIRRVLHLSYPSSVNKKW